ncbi:hypothetical protein DFJ58DRAFT_842084 [Suillus subalutaceus]|uniref:uncharacterized protein n=1 Tax=Suillus subalutaceus TaxID=48586 RepID=UPI001B872C3F|nr:uncharacterized protein DFJ58DRAFT_842084 [Suillus subalutaceus]KAG1851595.1 hypothetical protein DFJ58DRAFT_842084 [Suillus subalutaceus]
MNKQHVFSPFGDTKENVLEVSQRPVPPPSRPFHVVIAPGQAREGPVPPPSCPFHVVIAPGQAREGHKHTKQGPHPPEVQYPLTPHRQNPGPIPTSQTYLRTLVLERWDAELRRCDEACKVQLSERMQGPISHQTCNTEKKQCEEARKVQLLEILLASHGITSLV